MDRIVLLAAGIAAVALLVFTGVLNFGTASVISAPTEIKLTDGTVWWLTSLSINVPQGESLDFYYRVGDNVKPYAYANGTTLTPKTSFSVTMSPSYPTCTYSIVRHDKVNIVDDFYVLNPNPVRSLNVVIAPSKDLNHLFVMDGAIVNGKTLKDPDGKGEIRFETQGFLAGAKDCPTAAGEVGIWVKGGQIYFCQKQYTGFLGNCFGGNKPFTYWFIAENGQYGNVLDVVNGRASSFVAKMPVNSIGSPVITVTADADYFDAVSYTPPKYGKPEIQSFTASDSVTALKQGTLQFVVKNVGVSSDSFLVTFKSSDASFSKNNYYTALIQPGEVFSDSLSFTARGASTDVSGSRIDFTICSTGGQFSIESCASSSAFFSIKADNGLFPPVSTCGNGVCESIRGETSLTCPNDCKSSTPTCGSGEVLKTDSVGNYYCAKEGVDIPWVWIIIAGGLLVVVFLLFGVKRK